MNEILEKAKENMMLKENRKQKKNPGSDEPGENCIERKNSIHGLCY